jgi:beta-lactamase regulating signal transducer with metallopeptidase domain
MIYIAAQFTAIFVTQFASHVAALPLINWISPVTLRLLGFALLHFVWQGTALAALLSLALSMTRASSVRYALALATLVLMLAAPVVTFFLLRQAASPATTLATASALPWVSSMPVVTQQQVTEQQVAEQPVAQQSTSQYAPAQYAGAQPSSIPQPFAFNSAAPASRFAATIPADFWRSSFVPRVDFLLLFVEVWFAGVLLLSIRTAGGVFFIQRMRKREAHPLSEPLHELCLSLQRRLGLRGAIRFCETATLDAPAVIGWMRPVVLLPLAAISGLSRDQLEMVIAHELAHIRRLDSFANLFQIVAETLLFYHPAVWWVSKRVRAEREHCCDDAALAVSGDAVAYARALALMAEWRAAPGLVMAVNRGPLASRVARLLGEGRPPSRFRGAGLAASVICLCGAAIAANAFLGVAHASFARSAAGTSASDPLTRDASTITAPSQSATVAPAATGAPSSVPPVAAPSSSATQDSSAPSNVAQNGGAQNGMAQNNIPPSPPVVPPPPVMNIPPPQALALAVPPPAVPAPQQQPNPSSAAPLAPPSAPSSAAPAAQPPVAPPASSSRPHAPPSPEWPWSQQSHWTHEWNWAQESQWSRESLAQIQAEIEASVAQSMAAAQSAIAATNRSLYGYEYGFAPQVNPNPNPGANPGPNSAPYAGPISGPYADAMKSAGLDNVTMGQLFALKSQDVTPDYVKQMHALGVPLDAGTLIALKAQGVTPEYIKEMRDAGLNIDPHQFIAMRAQGITPEFLRQMHELSLQFSGNDILGLKTMGVTPEYVKQMRDLGLQPSAIDLYAMRSQGITPEYIKSLQAAGLHLSPMQYVAAKAQAITPELVESAHKHGFDNLRLDQLIALKVTGLL